MKNSITSKRTILIIISILLSILIISLLSVVIIKKDSKYSEDKINRIVKYLEINSYYYNGLPEELKKGDMLVKISSLSNNDLNRQISSYIITNLVPNIEYDYNNCPKCYKYFSKDDNIKFYNPNEVENIYKELYGKNISKITQEDIIDYNILYYNNDINMYYINILYLNTKPTIISSFKEYKYKNNKLYLDYYYTNIDYNEEDNLNIKLVNLNNSFEEIEYNDIFDDNNQIINFDKYSKYFNTIRYTFIFDKKDKIYKLEEMKVLS